MKGDKDALKKAQDIIDVLRKGAEQQQQQQQQTKRQKTQQTQVTEALSFKSPTINGDSLAQQLKSSAPDEESKGAAELMCTHCRELFSPHSWELHMELGCPQEPAEQVMSEVESTGQQVGASREAGVYSCEKPCNKSFQSQKALTWHQKTSKTCRANWGPAQFQLQEQKEQILGIKRKAQKQLCDAKRKGTEKRKQSQRNYE